MNSYEKKLLQEALPELRQSITKGIEFCQKANQKVMNK